MTRRVPLTAPSDVSSIQGSIADQVAAAVRKDGRLADFVKNRYSSWDEGVGEKIEAGTMNFRKLEKYMLKKGEATKNESGRQEYLENLINEFI